MAKVTVIIPAYNCAQFISEAIESVLAQIYKDYEIVVVDDGSTDTTAEVLKKYKGKISYVYQANGGPSKARNTGVVNSNGEYIAFLDQDDAWLPEKLQLQVELLEYNEKAALVYTDGYILGTGSFARPETWSRRIFQERQPRRGNVLTDLFLDNFILTSSVIVRKKCLEEAGIFDLSLPPVADYDRWMNIAALYEIDFINAPLVKHRDHSGCFKKNTMRMAANAIKVLNGALAAYPALRQQLNCKADRRLARFYVILGKAYLAKGNIGQAWRNLRESVRLTKSLSYAAGIICSIFTDFLKNIPRRMGLRRQCA